MRVMFADSALSDPQAARHLTAIWWMMVDQRHAWVVPDAEAVHDSLWLQHLGHADREQAQDMARRCARRPAPPQVVVEAAGGAPRHAQGAWCVPADRAERWLRTPVQVLVENVRVDGSFLRLVMLRVGEGALKGRLGADGFRELRSRWTGAFGDDVLFQVRHGGGDTTADQLEIMVESHPDLPPSLAVVVDSDRSGPHSAVGQTAAKVRAVCLSDFGVGWGPRVHILDKHEVENYLPHRAIEEVRPGAQRLLHACSADFDDLKELVPEGRKLARDVLTRADVHLHERSLRDRAGRNGRELDEIVRMLIDLL